MLSKVSTASISNYTEWLNVALNTSVGGGGYTLVWSAISLSWYDKVILSIKNLKITDRANIQRRLWLQMENVTDTVQFPFSTTLEVNEDVDILSDYPTATAITKIWFQDDANRYGITGNILLYGYAIKEKPTISKKYKAFELVNIWERKAFCLLWNINGVWWDGN